MNWEERPKPPVTCETEGSFCQLKRGQALEQPDAPLSPSLFPLGAWEKRVIKLLLRLHMGFALKWGPGGSLTAPAARAGEKYVSNSPEN